MIPSEEKIRVGVRFDLTDPPFDCYFEETISAAEHARQLRDHRATAARRGLSLETYLEAWIAVAPAILDDDDIRPIGNCTQAIVSYLLERPMIEGRLGRVIDHLGAGLWLYAYFSDSGLCLDLMEH